LPVPVIHITPGQLLDEELHVDEFNHLTTYISVVPVKPILNDSKKKSLSAITNMILVSETSLTIAVVAMIFVTFVVGAFYKKRDITSKEGHPLPPGPPAKWFWDSVMPTVNISSTLNRWANEYGPVITLRRGSEITIVIGRVSVRCHFVSHCLSSPTVRASYRFFDYRQPPK